MLGLFQLIKGSAKLEKLDQSLLRQRRFWNFLKSLFFKKKESRKI